MRIHYRLESGSVTKHYCDKCGEELPPDVSKNVKIGLWIHYEADDWKNAEAYDSWKVITHDICQKCAEKIETDITGCSPTSVL